MSGGSQHGGAALGFSPAMLRHGLGPCSVMAFQEPSQRDVASLASMRHGEGPSGRTFLVPFDFLVCLDGPYPVELLDGSQHGGAELGMSRAMLRRGLRPRSMMAFWVPSQRDVADLGIDCTWAGYARWVSLGALSRS